MKYHSKYRDPFELREFFHLYNKAVRKDQLFFHHDNFLYFLKKFHSYTKVVATVYSYWLLNNHFHFLVKIHENANPDLVTEQLRRFFISYSKALNNHQNRKGTLFERHLKRVKIRSDEQLLWTIYYIHRNPVHHNLTLNYQKYRWSSYPVILSNKKTNLKRNKVLELFSGVDKFVEFHNRNIEDDILLKRIAFKED